MSSTPLQLSARLCLPSICSPSHLATAKVAAVGCHTTNACHDEEQECKETTPVLYLFRTSQSTIIGLPVTCLSWPLRPKFKLSKILKFTYISKSQWRWTTSWGLIPFRGLSLHLRPYVMFPLLSPEPRPVSYRCQESWVAN